MLIMLTGASAAETSGSIGIIISAIAGVIIGLILALVFVRRRCYSNDERLLTPKAPKGPAASTVKPLASKTGTAEWGVELVGPEHVQPAVVVEP